MGPDKKPNGRDMERLRQDQLPQSSGLFVHLKLTIRLLANSAVSIPSQFSREFFQDARHTLRLWVRRPWHTGFAILALAIGIGANTGVFSVVNALLLRSLPFQDPSRLVSLRAFFPPRANAKEFHEWRQQQSAYLADAALIELGDVNLGEAQNVIRAHVAMTSWNFFSLLGTQPVIGRAFHDGEDTSGNNNVAVISYGIWQELFAGDARVLGSTIRLNGMPLTIVGVAPSGFDYPKDAALWKAAEYSPGNYGWETIARLSPGVTLAQGRAAFAVEADRLHPRRNTTGNAAQFPTMISLQDELAGPVKNASLMLMAGVVFILLIACTNVANLLMARTADRAQELAVRSALGASRGRIARQLLTECLLLSFVAAIAGLFVAFWTTSIAAKVQPGQLPMQSYSILDWRVLCFAVAIAIVSSLLFGVLPSLYAGRFHAFGMRAAGSARGARLIRETLVAAQVTLTIILLTASVSVGRAFVNLMRIDRGFNVRGLVTVSVSLNGTTRDADGHQLPYLEEVLERIRRIPGVQSASGTEFLPLKATGFIGGRWGLDGRDPIESSMRVPVLSDYFKTMGGRILYGREFTEAEINSDAKVAIVNERFANDFGSPADVLAHQITQGDRPTRKIIGVVRATDYMTEGANQSQIFIPDHSPGGFDSTFVARVDGRAEDMLPVIRDTIRTADPSVPVFSVKTMEQRMASAVVRPQFYRTAVTFFAGFALLLAVIGIYSVVSYAVAQRTREMGVRLALGATPAMLRGNMLRQGLITVAAGATFGIAGAMFTGRFLESLVEGARSVDVSTFSLSILFIGLVASISIWAATRRIARLDVLEILRID
jgi:putative ABC transport system permease protein